MDSIHRKTPGRPRRGYTLLELMLVLGILLILAGLTWPGILRMHEQHRLHAGVEMVRGHLAAGRLRAIDTGLVYQFVYEPGGRNFQLLPFEADSGMSGSTPPTLFGALAEPLRFAAPEEEQSVNMPLNLPGQATASAVGGTWSLPILFAPDGTATPAALDVMDDENRAVRLSVRGLTAAVSVGSIRQRLSP